MAWARDTLHALEVGEAAAAVRIRLTPNPWPGESFARVEWTGARSADVLAEALEARLAEHGEPWGCKVRIEVLDGVGTSIRGLGRSVQYVEKPTMAATQTREREVIDVEAEDAPGSLVPQLVAPVGARNALAHARALVGSETVEVPVAGLIGLCFHTMEVLQDHARHMGGLALSFGHQNRQMAEVHRRAVVGQQDHVESMYALALTSTEKGARAEADVELAETRAALGAVNKPPMAQAVDLVTAGAKILEAHSKARGAKPSAPSSPTTPAPAPVPAPAPAPSSPPTPAASTGPNLHDLILDPSVPPEVLALGLQSLDPSVRARLEAVARAITAGAAPEDSKP